MRRDTVYHECAIDLYLICETATTDICRKCESGKRDTRIYWRKTCDAVLITLF